MNFASISTQLRPLSKNFSSSVHSSFSLLLIHKSCYQTRSHCTHRQQHPNLRLRHHKAIKSTSTEITLIHRQSKQFSTSSKMVSKKVLVVFGATGMQGGSVLKSVLGDAKMREEWIVRGVTRDVSKPSAKALEKLGAETVTVSFRIRTCEQTNSTNTTLCRRISMTPHLCRML